MHEGKNVNYLKEASFGLALALFYSKLVLKAHRDTLAYYAHECNTAKNALYIWPDLKKIILARNVRIFVQS